MFKNLLLIPLVIHLLCPLNHLGAQETRPIKIDSYFNSQNPNTADLKYSQNDLQAHLSKVNLAKPKKDTNKIIPIFPKELIHHSLINPSSNKHPMVLMIFQSKDAANRRRAVDFLNLWYQHKNKANFIMIDPELGINYLATLLLKEYWKGENLKVIAFDSSGKIRIQLLDPGDLKKLDRDLTTLESHQSQNPHGLSGKIHRRNN